MWLACIEPDKPDPDKRTCGCPVCPNVTVRVVKYLSQQNRQPDQVADIVASATAAGTINAASTLRDIRFSPNSDRVARWECLLRATSRHLKTKDRPGGGLSRDPIRRFHQAAAIAALFFRFLHRANG